MNSELKAVDFSGQGLTVVPSTIFKRPDIGFLNLSSNNIRSLPHDITKLSMLQKLDISANGLRCNNPNDTTTLPKEMEQMIFLTDLSLAECNLIYLPATVWQLTSLTHLDISRNRLGKLPAELGNLFNLRHLNAQQAGLKVLPPEIVCCEKLEVLLLFGNPIDALPDTMRELNSLEVVTINMRAFCNVIDDYMDNMLQKQQIQSEHIAPVLFDIPHLRALELENCKINHLPENISKGLGFLSIASNYFTALPVSVCNIECLHTLDISNNDLTALPSAFSNLQNLRRFLARRNRLSKFQSELLALSKLEYLDLGRNEISALPAELDLLESMRVLILDENKIPKLPSSVCNMIQLETLDITGNKVAKLPGQMHRLTNIRTAHTYEGLFRVGLWLHRNPLTNPPPNVWKTKDPLKIWGHLRSAEIRGITNLQTLKVVTLGPHAVGKSTLVRALTTGRGGDHVTPTAAYNVVPWTSPDTVRCVFFDLGTHPTFEALVPKFLGSRALILLAVDVSAVLNNGFAAEVGPWLETVAEFAPGAPVLLVATKVDRHLAPEEEEEELEEEGEEEQEETMEHYSKTPTANQDGPEGTAANQDGPEATAIDQNDPETTVANQDGQETAAANQDDRETTAANQDGPETTTANQDGQETAAANQVDPETTAANQDGPETTAADQNGPETTAASQETASQETTAVDQEALQTTVTKSKDSDTINVERMSQEDFLDDEMNDEDEEEEEEAGRRTQEELLRLSENLWEEAAAYVAAMAVSEEAARPVLCCPGRVPLLAIGPDSIMGVREVSVRLETIAIDEKMFPHNRRYVPRGWLEAASAMKRQNAPFLKKEEVEEMLSDKFGMRGQAAADCITYLHDNGLLFHFENIPGLSELIFHRPHRLQSLIACLCRPDLADYLNYAENRVFKCRGHLSEDEFATARHMTTTYGEFCQPLIDCFLFELQTRTCKPRESLATLVAVAEAFGLGYGTSLPEVPTSKIFDMPVIIMPYANCSETPDDLLCSAVDPPVPEPSEAAWRRHFRTRFPVRVAPSFWELLVVLLHREVEFRLDWRCTVYARRDGCHVLLTRQEDPPVIACTAWADAVPEVDLAAWFAETMTNLQKAWPCVRLQVEEEK